MVRVSCNVPAHRSGFDCAVYVAGWCVFWFSSVLMLTLAVFVRFWLILSLIVLYRSLEQRNRLFLLAVNFSIRLKDSVLNLHNDSL